MARKSTTVAPLTSEQIATAHALMMRENAIARADRAASSVEAVADGVRNYAGATATAGLVGVRCTGVFLKRLVFGAPKQRVEIPQAAYDTDTELRACLKRHGVL